MDTLRPVDPHSLELRALSREHDPELRAEGLLSFASRQERAGHSNVAASIYQEILADQEVDSSTPILASVQRRAQRRLNALTGENAELGARVEVLAREFTHQVAEPSTLLAMGLAGAAFRATRYVALARLAANPSANLLTRGLGARGLAGFAGFAVEAPTFTLAGRLASQGLGRSTDWSGTALGHDLASGYLMLGALRSGGLLASGLGRQIGRLGTGGLAPAPVQTLLQQTGMLAGILGAQRLEEISGLRQARPGSNNLVEGLGLLLQFNVAGRLVRSAFGERFHQMENGLELRTEALAQANRGPRQPLFPELDGFGLQPALAMAESGPRAPRAPANEPDIRIQQTFMIGKGRDRGETTARNDETGIQVVREVRNLPIPESGDLWAILRRWIEQQKHPIIVGELVMNTDLAQVQMINRAFAERLGWSEAELRGQSVRKTFHSLSDSFIGSRVTLLGLKLVASNWAEFDPTKMRILTSEGNPIQAVGAGGIRNIRGKRIAVGIFTEIGGNEASARDVTPSPTPTSAVRTVAPPPPLRSDEAGSHAHLTAMEHFKNVTRALGNSSNPPKDKK